MALSANKCMAESFQRRELVHRTQCFYFFFCNVIRGHWGILMWLEFPTRCERLKCWAVAIYRSLSLPYVCLLLPDSFHFPFLLRASFFFPLLTSSLYPPNLLSITSPPSFPPFLLPFLIKALARIPSHLLLSPRSMPLLLSLPPSVPPPHLSLSLLLNLSLSEGPEWGRQIVWSWMLILGDRHHMSHSHNHRAPLNPPIPTPPPPFWLHNTAAQQSKIALGTNNTAIQYTPCMWMFTICTVVFSLTDANA